MIALYLSTSLFFYLHIRNMPLGESLLGNLQVENIFRLNICNSRIFLFSNSFIPCHHFHIRSSHNLTSYNPCNMVGHIRQKFRYPTTNSFLLTCLTTMSCVFSIFLYHFLCIPSVQNPLLCNNEMALCNHTFCNPNVVHNPCTLDCQLLLLDVSFLLTCL